MKSQVKKNTVGKFFFETGKNNTKRWKKVKYQHVVIEKNLQGFYEMMLYYISLTVIWLFVSFVSVFITK